MEGDDSTSGRQEIIDRRHEGLLAKSPIPSVRDAMSEIDQDVVGGRVVGGKPEESGGCLQAIGRDLEYRIISFDLKIGQREEGGRNLSGLGEVFRGQ
jgi:hypothetical protein